MQIKQHHVIVDHNGRIFHDTTETIEWPTVQEMQTEIRRRFAKSPKTLCFDQLGNGLVYVQKNETREGPYFVFSSLTA